MIPAAIQRNSVIVLCMLFGVVNLLVFLNHSSQQLSTAVLSRPSIFGQGIIDNYDQDVNDDASDSGTNELDGCYHVYLDVGSNIGNQVRKLYEPHLFIKAGILEVFDRFFGPVDSRHLGGVCAIGFEPNPRHTQVLESVQSAYAQCGWRAKFFTKTAAAHSYGLATFYSDDNEAQNEWGGSILESKVAKTPAGVTKMVRLADYILNKVMKRKLPRSLDAEEVERKPSVVMKLDIEGSELEVLTDLIVSGALQHVDLALVEYHTASFEADDSRSAYLEGLEKAVDTLTFLSKTLRLKSIFNVDTFDDESYGNTEFPLPQCNARD